MSLIVYDFVLVNEQCSVFTAQLCLLVRSICSVLHVKLRYVSICTYSLIVFFCR